MNFIEYNVLANGSMAANITSPSIHIRDVSAATLQANWTGTPSGSLILQISNDELVWTDYSGSTALVSGPGNFAWNMLSAPFPFVRINYLFAGGTGLLNLTLSGKGPS
jgi:hypothetical protein